MSRILLVDDSPHAQRMGERILTEEGFEVVAVSTADSALIRLEDVDPDVVIADTFMPGRNGFDVCHYVKLSPHHRHTKVVLTAGVLDPLDEEQVKKVQADGSLRKPFEASALVAAVRPLAEAAAAARSQQSKEQPAATSPAKMPPAAPFIAVVDSEQVHAAVTIALDAAMANIVDEISRRVVSALSSRRPEPHLLEPPPAVTEPMKPQEPLPAPPPPATLHADTVRRVQPLRVRSGSILGLDLPPVDPPESD